MRTKTLLLSAALVAAGALSAMAQTSVYSLNVVGYVTVTIPPGFSMVANPFDDGNGNFLTNVIAGDPPNYDTVPDGTFLYPWNNSSGSYGNVQEFIGTFGWYDPNSYPAVTNAIPPGAGFYVDSGSTTTNFTITFVGNVQQGSHSVNLGPGFTFIGSPFPTAVPVGASGITAGPNDPTAPTLQMNDQDGDFIYAYNNGTFTLDGSTSNGGTVAPGNYDVPEYVGGYGWFDPAASDGAGPTNGPVLYPGQGVFFFRGGEDVPPTGSVTWTTSFTVQ